MRTSRDDRPIYQALTSCAGWGAVARVWLVGRAGLLFTHQMRAHSRPDISLPDMGREGTDCSYCNGVLCHGSRKKTPYVVGILAQPRGLAHTMQQPPTKWMREGKGRENRESLTSVAHSQARGNANFPNFEGQCLGAQLGRTFEFRCLSPKDRFAVEDLVGFVIDLLGNSTSS